MYLIKIPMPSKLELILAKLLGKKFHNSCLDAHISGYLWKGRTYVTKNWTEPLEEEWKKIKA